jgi:hypothetical protein
MRTDPGEILEDVTVQAIVGRIRNLEASLSDCEEEIADIREAAGARAADLRQPSEPAGASADPGGAGQEVREEEARVDDDFVVEDGLASPATAEEAAPEGEAPAEEQPEDAAPETPPKKTRKRKPRKPTQE